MHNKPGYSLLFFLLYLMSFSMIALFTAHSITSLLLPTLSATHTGKSLMALHVASDLFVRDIRMMRGKPHTWKVIMPHELVWHEEDAEYDIGWRYKDNHLERREGIYNQGWKKRKRASIVATGIERGTFTVEQANDRIIGVEMTVMPAVDPKKAVVCYVATS